MTDFKKIAIKAERLDSIVTSMLDDMAIYRKRMNEIYDDSDQDNWTGSWAEISYNDYANRVAALTELVDAIGRLKL